MQNTGILHIYFSVQKVFFDLMLLNFKKFSFLMVDSLSMSLGHSVVY